MRQEVAHWAKEQMRQQLTGQTSAAATRPSRVGAVLGPRVHSAKNIAFDQLDGGGGTSRRAPSFKPSH